MALDNEINVDHLSFSYQNSLLFDDLSFKISGGQFTAMLGASGIGKSSLLKIIAGLLEPLSGHFSCADGQPLDHRFSYMAQQDMLYPWLNIINNITLGDRLRHTKPDRARALQLLEKIGLADVQNQLPATLSGGMRQRAALARTLYENRPIILMDEPFSALDAMTRHDMQDLVADVLKDKTVFMITHDPYEAVRLCHHLLVLHGKPAQITSINLSGKPPRRRQDFDLALIEDGLMPLLRGA